MLIGDAAVNYAVTLPGAPGRWVAFAAELGISFGLMLMVLIVSNRRALNRYTGLFAGTLVALYITFEAPLSGMSMNPARTRGVCVARPCVERRVDLLPGAAARDAAGSGDLSALARRGLGPVLQAAPRERQPLHFPVQVWDARRCKAF